MTHDREPCQLVPIWLMPLHLEHGHPGSVFMVAKTCTDTACHGVIFSYTAKKTFAVWHRGTIVITYDDFTWDTEAVLEDDKWNQISVVWTKKSYKLEVYVFDSDGRINKYATPSSDNPIPRPNPFLA